MRYDTENERYLIDVCGNWYDDFILARVLNISRIGVGFLFRSTVDFAYTGVQGVLCFGVFLRSFRLYPIIL